MTRALAFAVTALLALLALPGAALAATKQDDLQRGRSENAIARTMVDQALTAAKAHDYPRAYTLARSAYLDHYEYVEIPLRLKDPNLVLDTEFKFAQLRNDLSDRKPIDTIVSDVSGIRDGIVSTDRKLAERGVAAPLVAFGFSFSILFREGVEAVLLIAILLSSLAAGQAANYRRPLGLGVLGAAGATAVTWLVFSVITDLAPVNRELMEAITALLAVVVLIAVTFWLIARIDQRRRMEFMRARIASAVAAGSATAFMALGFTAVYREGFETVLFYKALALFAEGLGVYILAGALTAAAALGGIAWAILKAGRKLPLKGMLVAGASVLLLLSVAFAGNAVRSLQGADVIAATPVDGFRLPVLLAELTGIHPTQEGLIVQAVLAVVFLSGAAWVFALQPARRRKREALIAASAAAAHAKTNGHAPQPAESAHQEPVNA